MRTRRSFRGMAAQRGPLTHRLKPGNSLTENGKDKFGQHETVRRNARDTVLVQRLCNGRMIRRDAWFDIGLGDQPRHRRKQPIRSWTKCGRRRVVDHRDMKCSRTVGRAGRPPEVGFRKRHGRVIAAVLMSLKQQSQVVGRSLGCECPKVGLVRQWRAGQERRPGGDRPRNDRAQPRSALAPVRRTRRWPKDTWYGSGSPMEEQWGREFPPRAAPHRLAAPLGQAPGWP